MVRNIENHDSDFIRSSGYPFPKDLIAFWDFSEEEAPYKTKAGVDSFPLYVSGTTAPTRVEIKPFGTGLQFNGVSDYLCIPGDDVGALHVATSGDEVTVVAWIKRPDGAANANGFIAGLWQEDDNNPKRQYGMFTHLPMYGGWNRVCGHVSETGGASPNIPYSRDYSTSARMINREVIRCIGFTYDGNEIKSYMDGISDIRDDYTEPDTPYGEGLTYAKNPYVFDLGLNRHAISDFTVGAVKLTAGMGNFFNGILGGLAIFKRALSDKEMMKLHTDTLVQDDPIQHYDFMQEETTAHKAMGDYGWLVTGGCPISDYSNISMYSWTLCRGSGTGVPYACLDATDGAKGFNFFEPNKFGPIPLNQIANIEVTMNGSSADNSIKLCVSINGQWYATSADYYDTVGVSADDWSAAVVRSITIDREVPNWIEFNYVKGSELSLADAVTDILPTGEVESFGIWANELVAHSVIRLTDIKINR